MSSLCETVYTWARNEYYTSSQGRFILILAVSVGESTGADMTRCAAGGEIPDWSGSLIDR
jgi:hypothetical protein